MARLWIVLGLVAFDWLFSSFGYNGLAAVVVISLPIWLIPVADGDVLIATGVVVMTFLIAALLLRMTQ